MKKKPIIIILVLIIICIIIYLIYWNKTSQNRLDNNETEYHCSFTKTYKISNIWTVDTVEEVPGMTYIMVEQFQNDDKVTLLIPTELLNTLQENKYYEFNYTIKGKNKTINTMDDINEYFKSDYNNPDFKITLNINETDKQGLDQIQENICLPK